MGSHDLQEIQFHCSFFLFFFFLLEAGVKNLFCVFQNGSLKITLRDAEVNEWNYIWRNILQRPCGDLTMVPRGTSGKNFSKMLQPSSEFQPNLCSSSDAKSHLLLLIPPCGVCVCVLAMCPLAPWSQLYSTCEPKASAPWGKTEGL